MNLHPDVLSQAAFLGKPRSRRVLYHVIGLQGSLSNRNASAHVWERIRVVKGGDPASSHSSAPRRPQNPRTNQINCWNCGQQGHVKGAVRAGNRQRPGGRPDPGAHL